MVLGPINGMFQHATAYFWAKSVNTPRSDLQLTTNQWGNISEIMYPIIIALAKLSICIQFLHIFVPDHNTKRFWILQAFIWINMSWFFACFFISIFQCSPRERAWDPLVEGTCLNYQNYIVATGIFNCVSDVLMLLFPLVSVWNLRMSMNRKFGISTIFLVGLL